MPLWYLFAVPSFLLYSIFNLGWWKGLLNEAGGDTSAAVQVAISTIFFLTWALIPGTSQRAMPGGWSIESEMAHYALFPFIRNFLNLKLIALISICGYLAALNDYLLESELFLEEIALRLESLSIFTTLPFFLGGLLLVSWGRDSSRKYFTFPYIPFWLFSAIGFYLLLRNQVPFGQFWEALLFGLLAYATSFLFRKKSRVSSLISGLGKYSYFIYFCHFYLVSAFVWFQEEIQSLTLFDAITRIPAAFPILLSVYFGLALFSSLLLGQLSFKYFEGPILDRARRIR